MTDFIKGLLKDYIENSIKYGETILAEGNEESDRYCEEIESIFLNIKELGDVGLDGLSSLLCHENESVRLWAASHLLNYKKYNSENILEKIKNSDTIIALTAELTLIQWRKGKITY